MTPDRLLDRQDTYTLSTELKRISAQPAQKGWVSLEIGAVQDREAQRLGWQLWTIFEQSRWNAKWKKEPPKDIKFNPTLPVEVVIWTDQPNNMGTFLSGALWSAGVRSNVNPGPLPPNFKGTLVWVGYKQWP